MDPAEIFRFVDVLGVIANALIGSALARVLGYDLIGFLVLGVGTALGGGMIRDALLGIGFPVALTDGWYLGGALAASLVSYFIPFEGRWSKRALSLADVLALGCWSATGASKGLSAGLDWIPSIFLGVITATMGGLLRDVMVNRIPAIFGGSPLYASFSVIAATQMVIFQSEGYYEIGMGSAIVMCAVFGLAARHFNWQLPTTAYDIRIAKEHLRKLRFGRHARSNLAGEILEQTMLNPALSDPQSSDISERSSKPASVWRRRFRRKNESENHGHTPRGLREETDGS